MPLRPGDYDGARRLLAELLEEIGLADYTFAIEPGDDGWRIRIECVADGDWQTSEIDLPYQPFAGCSDSPAARRAILAELEGRLRDCRRAGSV